MHHKAQPTLESAVERQIVEEGVTRAKRTGEANEKLFEALAEFFSFSPRE